MAISQTDFIKFSKPKIKDFLTLLEESYLKKPA